MSLFKDSSFRTEFSIIVFLLLSFALALIHLPVFVLDSTHSVGKLVHCQCKECLKGQSNTCRTDQFMNIYTEHITLSVIYLYPSWLLFIPSSISNFPAIYLCCCNLDSLSLTIMLSLMSILCQLPFIDTMYSPALYYVYATPEIVSLFPVFLQKSEEELCFCFFK